METWVQLDDEPAWTVSDPGALLVGYLAFYQNAVLRKLDGLSERDATTVAVPSGWAPLALARHLRYLERRWFRWGFLAEPVDDPHGDVREIDGVERWYLSTVDTNGSVLAELRAEQASTREIVAAHRLDEPGRVGGRFPLPDGSVPTLGRVVGHVLQEYARHAGHLDIARELADGAVGE